MAPLFFIRKISLLLLHAIFISGAFGVPAFIAHRGASVHAPENTMAAFRLAWEQGADGIEADFFLTKDAQVVCIHDKNTKRTSSGNLVVAENTLTELRKLDYGSWKDPKFKGEPIPLLTEILDELPKDKWFFLEIKDDEKIVPHIAQILREKRPDQTRLVIISFNAGVIKKCREMLPEYRACLLHALNGFGKPGQAEKLLTEVRATGSQGLIYKEQEAVPKEWLSNFVGPDKILATWTVNDLQPALRAIERGAAFLITDRPAGLRAELKANLKK